MTSTLNFGSRTAVRFTSRVGIIRIRFAGETCELPLSTLDLYSNSSDGQVRRAVATALMIPVERLEEHTIDRHPNGNLTVRPDAMFV